MVRARSPPSWLSGAGPLLDPPEPSDTHAFPVEPGSVDGGHASRSSAAGPPPGALSGPIDAPGGGDTDINFARDGSTQYFADLYALTCLRAAATSDGGATAQQNVYPGGCAGLPGADRQWLAVYDPASPGQSAYAGPTPLVYLAYNNLVGPGPDGGEQW